jgi:hypothetical protein
VTAPSRWVLPAEAPSEQPDPAPVGSSRIVLLDLKLSTGSDTDGLALCSELTSRYPEVPS